MGVPTFMLLLHYSDWRWGVSGETTPWYASLKLFRQTRYDDWQAPLDALFKAVGARLAALPPPRKAMNSGR